MLYRKGIIPLLIVLQPPIRGPAPEPEPRECDDTYIVIKHINETYIYYECI